MNLITMLLLMPIWILLCLLFHEFGHYLTAKKLSLRPFFGFDHKGPYVGHDMTDKKKTLMVTKAGVIAGYLPLIITLAIDTTYGFYMILGWTMGNVREIKKIFSSL